MKDFDTKFRLIIVPFLFIAITTICVYSFLHWWFLIAHEVFIIDEAIANYAAPLVLSLIAVLIWLLPRLSLLDFSGKKTRNPLIGYLAVATVVIGAPTAIAQEYLISATGKLTRLTSISQISRLPKTKYYTLKNLYIDKQQTRPKTIINTSGKYNTNYNMIVYMPCPIFDVKYAAKKPDTLKLLAWLGIKYQKTIKNSSSAQEKQLEYNRFMKESQDDFDRRDLTKFSYLDRIGPGRELNKYADAITFSGVYNVSFILLVPRMGRYEDRNGDKELWLIGTFMLGLLVFMLIVLDRPLKKEVITNRYEYVSIPYKTDN